MNDRMAMFVVGAFATLIITLPFPSPISAEETPVVVATKGEDPWLTVAGDGTIHVAFGSENKVYYASSVDGGKTYCPPAFVADVDGLVRGFQRGARIAVTKGAILVSAIGREKILRAWRSTDGGRTWSGAIRVSDADAFLGEGMHALAADEQNHAMAVWLDNRPPRKRQMRIYAARSDDGGASWSPGILVYDSPSGSVCECCTPTIAMGTDGRLGVMWRNLIDGERDMHFVSSVDAGKTFDRPQKLGEGTWRIIACPTDGGGIAFEPGGKPITIWRREGTVYLSRPKEPEQALGNGRYPVITVSHAGPYVAWQEGLLVMASTPSDATPRSIAKGRFPTLASRAGGESPVMLAWEYKGAIMAQRLDK